MRQPRSMVMTPEKKYENPVNSNISPDIFEDEEKIELTDKSFNQTALSFSQVEQYVNKLDQKLLQSVQKSISGVLPPPSVTILNMSAAEILHKLETNKIFFWNNPSPLERQDLTCTSSVRIESGIDPKSLLTNVRNRDQIPFDKFPAVLEYRYHGLHYNCSKISEEIEDLCQKYAKRFVGAETQSTCTVFEPSLATSPSKRKRFKPKWGSKSPGRRLSHLARRRITFSSANLQAGGSSLAGLRARQILVDARKKEVTAVCKSQRQTPKKTPIKSPKVKTRTPSSSAKKKLALRFRKLTGEIEKSIPSSCDTMTSKRKLFKNSDKDDSCTRSEVQSVSSRESSLTQSPGVGKTCNSTRHFSGSSEFSFSQNGRSQLSRALFTSPRKDSPSEFKKSPLKQIFNCTDRKRKRTDSEDAQPSKFSRSMSMDFKSDSSMSKSFTRTRSDMDILLHGSQAQAELSDIQKKKLQWAVYEALRTQNVLPGNPQFKIFASILARVTRRFFNNYMNGVSNVVGTSEKMLRIAKHHVFAVVKGKSLDEIVAENLKNRSKMQKPQGYIGLEEFNNLKNKISSVGKDGVLQDRVNTIESWEKRKLEQLSKPESKIERIRKVINFGDDR